MRVFSVAELAANPADRTWFSRFSEFLDAFPRFPRDPPASVTRQSAKKIKWLDMGTAPKIGFLRKKAWFQAPALHLASARRKALRRSAAISTGMAKDLS
jgi:hypothetical protein